METFLKLREKIVYDWLDCENADELFRVTTFFAFVIAGTLSVLAMLIWVVIQLGFAWLIAIPVIYYLVCHAIMWPEDKVLHNQNIDEWDNDIGWEEGEQDKHDYSL